MDKYYPVIRDDRGNDNSHFSFPIPGFQHNMSPSLIVKWRSTSKRDTLLYPRVEYTWAGSQGGSDRRKLLPFISALHFMAMIEQYIGSGIIRQPVFDLIPVGQAQLGVPIDHWQVVRLLPDGEVLAPCHGYTDVSWHTGTEAVVKWNDSVGCNAGLRLLGGITELELQLARDEVQPTITAIAD